MVVFFVQLHFTTRVRYGFLSVQLNYTIRREGMKQRIAEMQQFLAGQIEQIEEYDEKLVRRMVEKITVYEDKFTVEFKSGTSVEVER